MEIVRLVSEFIFFYRMIYWFALLQLTFVIFMLLSKSEQSNSDLKSPEDFAIEDNSWKHDPYNDALHFYLGDLIEEHEKLKDVLMRLNPRDYVDWDSVEQKIFESSSSSWNW